MEDAKLLKEKEKEFLENFPTDANLSDYPENLIKYGFFHFTKAEFLKKSRAGVPEEGIEDKGLIADIGENSKNYEDKKRCYYSIGALGVLGLSNRVVFLNMVKLIESGMNPVEAKKIALQKTVDSFSDSVYLKMNINDGIEYDSSDFMTRRNSHTIKDVNISKEKLELISVNGSNNALDVLEFLYNNCDISQIRLNSHVVDGRVYEEENYIEELMDAIRQRTAERQQVSSKLKTIELFSKDLSIDTQKSNEKMPEDKRNR